LEKCGQCGGVKAALFKRPKAGWKLQVSSGKRSGEIRIVGDRAGLEFLAQCCLSVIGRKDASNHVLIDPLMYNASKGSIPISLCFDEDVDVEFAATGRPRP
jgi:hypothetical protein